MKFIIRTIIALALAFLCWVGAAQSAVYLFGQESDLTIVGAALGLFVGVYVAGSVVLDHFIPGD